MRWFLFVLAGLFAPAVPAAFKCVDEKGVSHFGDAPPEACANVTTFEINSAGLVVRRIDPPSKSAGPGDEAVKRETERASSEARRRDRALLDSYSSEREIDLARDRNVDMIKGRIESLNLQLQQVGLREKEAQRAVDSYKTQAPAPVRANLEKVQDEKAALAASLERQEKDLAAVRAKFEADKKRWVELREKR